MTLNTSVFILDPVRPKDVYAKCGQIIGQTERTIFTDEPTKNFKNGEWVPDPDGLCSIWNKPGQGLPALLDVHYRKGGPIKSSDQQCDRYCDEDCENDGHDPAHWIEVQFDTAYGYKDEQGRGCGDLHACYVAELGKWLDERHVRWKWENEFTGEIHSGYDRLIELCTGGFGATAWFQTTVMPALRNEFGEVSE